MIPLSKPAVLLVAIALLSFIAMVLLYAFPSSNPRTLALTTVLCWSWAAAYATACCFLVTRRLTSPEQRRTWRWIGAGCGLFFAGQLVWTYYDLRGMPPP